MYLSEKEKVTYQLKGKIVCLSIDRWSNVHNEPVICACVTAYNGEVYLVDFVDTSGYSQDAKYLTKLVQKTVQTTELIFGSIMGSVVTDSAANMTLCVRILLT